MGDAKCNHHMPSHSNVDGSCRSRSYGFMMRRKVSSLNHLLKHLFLLVNRGCVILRKM